MYLLFILGRTPKLASKEIESAATILPFQWSLSMVQAEVLVLKPESGVNLEGWLLEPKNRELLTTLQNRLGGTLKIMHGKVEVPKEKVREVLETYLAEFKAKEFGISLYGKGFDVNKLGISLKQQAKKSGHSLRYIQPKEKSALSTAQIYHHHLTQSGGEVVLIESAKGYICGPTLTVQNIDDYTKRDRGIPGVDAVSGVLPPKLAQMMIHAAFTTYNESNVVYDPFCGDGRVVMEAQLMRIRAYGSDLNPVKVASSQKNLEWINTEYAIQDYQQANYRIWQQDATRPEGVEVVVERISPYQHELAFVGEPYLGRALRKPLNPTEAENWAKELEVLYLNFFKVWAKDPGNVYQLHPDRMILVFPSVKLTTGQSLSLYDRIVDRLVQIGYSSVQVSDYGRPDALVSRQIIQISYMNN